MSPPDPSLGDQDAPFDEQHLELPLASETRDRLIGRVEELRILRGDTERPTGWDKNRGKLNHHDLVWKEAKRLDTESVTILRVLYADNPNSHGPDLAFHLLNLFIDLWELHSHDEACDYATQTIELHRSLYMTNPTGNVHAFAASLRLIHETLGWDFVQKVYPEAEGVLFEAVRIVRELHAADTVAHGPNLIESLHSLGEFLQYGDGSYLEAQEAYLEAVEIARELYTADPTIHSPRLVDALQSLGSFLQHGPNNYSEARQAYSESINILRKENTPTTDGNRPQLINYLESFGSFIESELELHSEAREVYREAVEIAKKLYDVNHIAHAPQLIIALQSLGSSLRNDSNLQSQAQAVYLEAVATARELYAADIIAFGHQLIVSLQSLGSFLHGGSTLSPEAREAYLEAVNISRELYAANSVAYGPKCVESLQSWGSLLQSEPKLYPEARNAYLEAVEISEALYKADLIEHGSLLAQSYQILSTLLQDMGLISEALDAAYQRTSTLKPVAKQQPRRFLRELLDAFFDLRILLEKLELDDKVLEVDQEASAMLNRSAEVRRLSTNIGEGSFGRVYRAEAVRYNDGDPEQGTSDDWFSLPYEDDIVVKMLNLQTKGDGSSQFLDFASLDRVTRRELFISYRLRFVRHMNVVQYHGFVIQKGKVGLVSTYFTGGSVMDYLKANKQLSKRSRGDLCRDVARGLLHLHTLPEPIIHGDLKPLNVVVHKYGWAALCDFGLSQLRLTTREPFIHTTGESRAQPHQRHTEFTATQFYGTLRYCSPEILEEENGIVTLPTLEADVYGFACTAAEILTELIPFAELKREAQIIDAIDDHFPPYDINSIIQDYPEFSILKACWDADPAKRPTMAEVCGHIRLSMESRDFEEDYGHLLDSMISNC